ncbi:class I SAM-dependent methyltransferase [Ensifer adhaerens]|uniref:class I SAM-dependent methyltransferase n=1 Tax=Ensifer canadensis TaxID=555315 RepID=UPI00148F5333|nr:class I SAM-dependent methyltransferase [Ensifer canadensis]NOV15864.1 class I SAM-dependent methyltransferase [Ensifer canadensis]
MAAETRYKTGIDVALSYIDNDYKSVNGMSSTLAAQASVELLNYQSQNGIRGPIVEIGSFEGRMLIALALASSADEKIYAFDTFNHPDETQLDRFRSNIRRMGIDVSRVVEKKGNSIDYGPWKTKKELGVPARFIHIDGDHRYNGVMHDLTLSHRLLKEDGVICMDDVLHPYYPGLTLAAHDYIRSNPDLVVFAVIDRDSLVAASKYLMCHRNYLGFYQGLISEKFNNKICKTTGDFFGNKALIVSNEVRS